MISIVVGCKKYLGEDQAESMPVFNASFVKNWYNKVFETTSEWKISWTKDRKYPIWSKGVYIKQGNLEIMEFPLIMDKSKLLVPTSSLSPIQVKRIASSSLKRILFIRNSNNEIFVREINYIPDESYLTQKGFDISNIGYGKPEDDFTGTLVVKKWDGTILSMRKLNAGKISGTIFHKAASNNLNNTASLSDGCYTITYCMMYEDCVVIGDVITDDCSEPYPDLTDCYDDLVCPGGANEDPCETYGIGCGEGGGSGGGGGNPGGGEPLSIVIDLIENDCLEKVLSQMNSNPDTYFYGLTNIFGSSESIHVTLYDYYDNSDSSALGTANGTIGGYAFQIAINTYHSQGSSEEDIAGTFLHAMVHAYLMAHPTAWDTNDPQHLHMMTQMMDVMANDLQLMFPNLDRLDALAIAYNGLTYDPDPVSNTILNIVQSVMVGRLQQHYPGTSLTQLKDLGKSYQKGGNRGTRSTICQ